MNVLIYGSGAIGCHIAHLLNISNVNLYLFIRKKRIRFLKSNGFNLIIKDNTKIITKTKILESNNIHFISELSELKNIKFDYIFITIKLINNTDLIYKKIKKLLSIKTSIVMPCTILPSWWLNKYSRKNIKQIIPIKKIIGMTMWVSGIMQNNNVVIKHTQRGYPLKEISNKNKSNADILRKMIRKKSKSPLVKNIYSEIYLKVINSFAFNLIAIKYNQSNNMLIKNQNAINEIKLIMYEFDKLVSYMGLPILQSVNSRVNQTLSSKKHTMSMLTDLRNGKKIEIKNQWLSLMQIDKAIKTNVALSENFYKSTIKLIGK